MKKDIIEAVVKILLFLIAAYGVFIFVKHLIVIPLANAAARTEAHRQMNIDKELQCRTEHGKEIMQYVKECTASLSVEENSDVVQDCELIAIKNLCGIKVYY